MVKLLRFLKPYILSVILILGLLFAQATCDLALPDYMSNIINVGIQQGGIENAVPEALRPETYDKISLFLDDSGKELLASAYRLADKDTLSEKDYNRYVKDYPLLESQSLYLINTEDGDTLSRLDDLLGKTLMTVYGLEKEGIKAFGEMAANFPADADPFQVLAMMPAEAVAQAREKISEAQDSLPETMISQAAIEYVKQEYTAIGMSLSRLQNNYIIQAGLIMLVISLLAMVASILAGFLAAKVAAAFSRDVRKDLFKKVESFSSAEFDKFSTASLITRTTNDIQQIQMFLVLMLRILFYAPILGVGGVIKVLSTKTSMGWVIGVAVMAILTLILILFAVAIPKFKAVQKLVDKVNLIVRESLVGILVIRAFSTQRHEENRFDTANKNLTNTNLFVGRIMALMMPVMMFIMNSVSVLIIWVGAHRVDEGVLQVGDMMAFITYTMQIIMSFLFLSMVSFILPRASVSAARIGEVLSTPVTIKDPAKVLSFDSLKKGVVEFKDVCFRYPGADSDVLSNISFTAKPGETTAFIGSTGSGKSTLVNLIPRFYDATKGQILLGGQDIRQVGQKDLREKIGYIPQKAVLFSGTIESNLKYGVEDASQEVLERSAAIAQADGFIKEKEFGYDEPISQGGTNVSGGQKQRLSIARALVKNADVYIFDDSFSALDYKTDAALRRALKKEMKDSTLLIVAQRISTIMNAEQIIVLDDGRIVGKGTHRELLQTCEVYKEIALSQLSKEELANE